MWWSIITLTTVGYGDVYPITSFGKFFGSLSAIFGVGLFAIPTGILASGFVEHKDDDVYNGEWKYGKKDGYGESLEVFGEGEDRYGNTVAKQLEYKGEWKDDEKHGQGVGKYTGYGFDWIEYKGPWKHDNEEGKGQMSWSSGRIIDPPPS